MHEQTIISREKNKMDRITSLLLADHPTLAPSGANATHTSGLGVSAIIPTRSEQPMACSSYIALNEHQNYSDEKQHEAVKPVHFRTPEQTKMQMNKFMMLNAMSHDQSRSTLLKQKISNTSKKTTNSLKGNNNLTPAQQEKNKNNHN